MATERRVRVDPRLGRTTATTAGLRDPSLQLDLEAALKSADAIANDLLPPRADDRVSGELAARFIRHLHLQLASGDYTPSAAEIVRVPKPGFTSRPAAVLTLTDRIVYEALVGALREPLSAYLLSPEIVIWPRERASRKRWREFERAPLSVKSSYVVRADISGFYDSIDHDRLLDVLVAAGGSVQVVNALADFLAIVMQAGRGLPQGLLASDALATTFLQPTDAAMISAGFSYWRHGDDIRIATQTTSEARQAILMFEGELRSRGLLINSAKCVVHTSGSYESDLGSLDSALRATHERLVKRRITSLAKHPNALTQVMRAAELNEQWEWGLFYHGRVSFEEVIEKVRQFLQPSQVQLAERVFADAIRKSPEHDRGLSKDDFHQRLVSALVRMTAGKSAKAIDSAASIIARFPDKTEILCRYLTALIQSEPAKVVAQVEDLLASETFLTDWQQAWLIRTLSAGMSAVKDETRHLLKALLGSDHTHWMVRAEALKALGSAGELSQRDAVHAWRNGPPAYRSDVLEGIARMAGKASWAKAFVSVAHLDPVSKVIAEHVSRGASGAGLRKGRPR